MIVFSKTCYIGAYFDLVNSRIVLECLSLKGQQVLFFFYLFIFFSPHHMSFVDFVALPPGRGRSVTDF